MRLLRSTACSIVLAGLVLLPAGHLPAAESPAKSPPTKAKTTKPKKKESAAAAQERERREDLERRVEKLEQQYEMQPPAIPPTDAGRPATP